MDDKVEAAGAMIGAPQMRCVLCGGESHRTVTINRSVGVYIVQCAKCGFIQTEPVSRRGLSYYYSTHYRGSPRPEQIAAGRAKSAQQAKSQVAFLQEILGARRFGAALDYGTADGELPSLLRSVSDRVYATEEDPRYLAVLKNEPWLTLVPEDALRAGRLHGELDLVTLSHVLEHLPDPGEHLQLFAAILKPGGHLLIDVPNEVELLQRGFQAMGHLHFFTADSLKWLLQRDGLFEVLHVRHCNRTVQSFIDSGFRSPENYSLADTPNGTTIRALVRNRDHGRKVTDARRIAQPMEALFEEYSARLVDYYHRLVIAEERVRRLEASAKLPPKP